MPADTEICHFTPSEEFWNEAQEFYIKEIKILAHILDKCEVRFEHVGGASIRGSLTKKDIDIQIIVEKQNFLHVIDLLTKYARIKNSENWTENKAIFKGVEKELSTDYLMSVVGTDAERQYREGRDLLKSDPALLERYNNLKTRFEGKSYKEYRPEKRRFWEAVYRDRLGIKDLR